MFFPKLCKVFLNKHKYCHNEDLKPSRLDEILKQFKYHLILLNVSLIPALGHTK